MVFPVNVTKALLRWLLLVGAAFLGLQLFFLARIATMAVWDPASTTFERSEAWVLLQRDGRVRWRQEWKHYGQISDHLKRAVIAAEDGSFNQHDGVDWNALEKAWERNQQAQAKAEKSDPRANARPGAAAPRPPKVVGGSTITQQLAKNLLLSGERSFWRKGQEFVLTLMLEALLDKRRILEIYLNHVEWGEGVFGAEAAAQHYFRKSAARLSPAEAARLAVMLPAPKRYEKMPNSAYLANRSRTILARMGSAKLP